MRGGASHSIRTHQTPVRRTMARRYGVTPQPAIIHVDRYAWSPICPPHAHRKRRQHVRVTRRHAEKPPCAFSHASALFSPGLSFIVSSAPNQCPVVIASGSTQNAPHPPTPFDAATFNAAPVHEAKTNEQRAVNNLIIVRTSRLFPPSGHSG
jgi:hypothetical protein